jgi:hypothetical protein
MLSQLLLNRLPSLLLGEMPQHYRESIIRKIGLTDLQSRDLFQRAVGLSHPIAHGQFAMVALRDDVR